MTNYMFRCFKILISGLFFSLLLAVHLYAWQTDGVHVFTAIYNQYYPMIVNDTSGGAIITWQDSRNDSGDIYAQYVDSTRSVPVND